MAKHSEVVFDKAASIRGAAQEISTILDDFEVIDGVLYLDGHRRDLDARIAVALGDIRREAQFIDAKATDLQD